MMKARQIHIDLMTDVLEDTLRRLAAIAGDNRFKDERRDGLLEEARTAGLAELGSRFVAERNRLEGQRAAAVDVLRRRLITPTPERALQLLYVRELLLNATWPGQDVVDLLACWKERLEAGDLVAGEIYRDFLPAYLRHHVPPYNQRPAPPLPDELFTLSQQTDRALMTTKEQEAADRIIEIAEIIEALETSYCDTRTRIEEVRFDQHTITVTTV